MSRETERHRRWLRAELPGLVSDGILEEPAAARLRAHYALDSLPAPRSWALLAFGVLGAALIGAGIILILAHNWEELGRGARAAIALGLLLAAQGLAGFAMLRRGGSSAWTESTALLLTLAVGASTALVSQTYHVQAELGEFLLSWLVLVVPVAYLLRSRFTAVFCMALALWLPSERERLFDHGALYLPVVAATLPFCASVARRAPGTPRTLLCLWSAALSVPIGLLLCLEGLLPHASDALLLPLLAGLFVTTAGLGRREPEPPSIRSPLGSVGLAGAAAVGFVLTFEDAARGGAALGEPASWLTLAAALALTLSPLAALPRALRERRWERALLFAVVVLGWLAAAPWQLAGTLALLANLTMLALGVGWLSSGLAHVNLRRTNVGLALCSMLMVLRFFDVELSLVVRGVSMMAVGLSFVAVNLWLMKRRRRVSAPQAGPRARPRGDEEST